jgi:hypothetical protein
VIYHFKTADDELFVLNTVTMRWGRASTILASPSITAAEKQLTQYVYSEEGDLVAMGGGVFNMEGRSPETKGPGAGLCSVGIIAIPYDDTLVMYVQANVPIKQDSFSSNPIKHFKYQILSQEPQNERAVAEPTSN